MNTRAQTSIGNTLRRVTKSLLSGTMSGEAVQESLRRMSISKAFWPKETVLAVIQGEGNIAGIKDEFTNSWLHDYTLTVVSTMAEATEIIKRKPPFALLTDLYFNGSPEGMLLTCLALNEGCGRVIVYPNLEADQRVWRASQELDRLQRLFLFDRHHRKTPFEMVYLVDSLVRHNKSWDPKTRALVSNDGPEDPTEISLRSWFTAMRECGFFSDLPPDGYGEIDEEAYR